MAFWQQMTLDWISGIETPYPVKSSDPFPTQAQPSAESWPELRDRFLKGAEQAASVAGEPARLAKCRPMPGPAIPSV